MNRINPYFATHITWEHTQVPEFPYQNVIRKQKWIIRINDFPEEDLYTLIIDEKEVSDFSDWPSTWKR